MQTSISVTGFRIVFNPTYPTIDSTSAENFTISCMVENYPKGSNYKLYNITLTSGNVNIAKFYCQGGVAYPNIDAAYTNRGASLTYVYNVTALGSSELTVTIPVSSLTYTDSKMYTCEMNFKTPDFFRHITSSRSLTVTGNNILWNS